MLQGCSAGDRGRGDACSRGPVEGLAHEHPFGALVIGGPAPKPWRAQLADVKKSTVLDWLDLLESMFVVSRIPVFSARPSRRALAAQPKFCFADSVEIEA